MIRPVEWWTGSIVSLWHGTSSASLPGILAEGLRPPPEDLEGYVSDICEKLVGVPLSDLPASVRRGIREHCMGPRLPYAGDGEPLVFLYPHPAVHRAAAYAYAFAADGGEISHTVRRHLETWRGAPLPPLHAGSKPVVVRVDLPAPECMLKGGRESLDGFAHRLHDVWHRKRDRSEGLRSLADFLNEAADVEVVIPNRIPPDRLVGVHAVIGRHEIDAVPLEMADAPRP